METDILRSEKLNLKPLKCYHCGDQVENKTIQADGHYFCCEGCKSVYEILNLSNLCTYYDFDKFPGIKKNQHNEEYLFLDNEEIQAKLIDFRDENKVKITLYIPSIHCTSCLWLLENLHKLNSGILRSEINFPKKEVTVFFDENQLKLKEVASLFDQLGYKPQFNLHQLSKKVVSRDNSLYIKLGVTGFCVGNIMLLSFPDYLGFEGLKTFLGSFFGYLSLILSLPVILYGASDYWTSSINAIKTKIINIDLPIALGLIVIFGRSVYEIFSHTGMGYLDSLTGLVFFLLIGKWYQRKTFEAISFERDYTSYFPVAITKIENNQETVAPIYQLKKGDTILIRNNDLIPVDSKIIKGNAEIDYSFVTGESNLVVKKAGERIFAGGRQKGEIITLEVEKEINQSYFTQLWNQDVFRKSNKLSLSTFANLTGKYFTIAVLILWLGTFLTWQWIDPSKAVVASVAVLIVFCPCTLALSIPFCFSNTMRILGKQGFYLKNTDSVETFGEIDTIVFDKTGTLTTTDARAEFIGKKLSDDEKSILSSVVKNSSHPLSKIIYNFLDSGILLPVQSFEEFAGKGLKGIVLDRVVLIGSSEYVTDIPEKDRTLESRTYVKIDQTVYGYFSIENKIRPGLEATLKSLSQNYEIHLISGDHSADKARMQSLFPNPSNIHFDFSPLDKLNYIRNLQSKGKKVMMVGDGLNDAGALKQSNAGVAVSDNVYNFSPSCDAIVSAQKLNRLEAFLSFCRSSSKIVKTSLLISLSYNISGLCFAMSAQLSPLIAAVLMPASSVSVVLFVITASNIAALKKKLL